jgi:hypothetical protein
MAPIFFTIGNELPIKVIPDTQAHLDGHTVLTYNYNVFYDDSKNDLLQLNDGNNTITDKMDDPNYYGCITFEKPGSVFSYAPGDQKELTQTEVEEVIEQLNHYRDNPALWKYLDN